MVYCIVGIGQLSHQDKLSFMEGLSGIRTKYYLPFPGDETLVAFYATQLSAFTALLDRFASRGITLP